MNLHVKILKLLILRILYKQHGHLILITQQIHLSRYTILRLNRTGGFEKDKKK